MRVPPEDLGYAPGGKRQYAARLIEASEFCRGNHFGSSGSVPVTHLPSVLQPAVLCLRSVLKSVAFLQTIFLDSFSNGPRNARFTAVAEPQAPLARMQSSELSQPNHFGFSAARAKGLVMKARAMRNFMRRA